MADGLQYYSGVGRGKGTIISNPDFRGMFAAAGKNAQAADAAKAKAGNSQQAWLQNALNTGDKGWVEDATYLDGLRNDFTSEYSAIAAKYDGQQIPAGIAQDLVNRANKIKFIAQNSQKQRDEYYKFVENMNKPGLDNETRAKSAEILKLWVATPTEQRTSLNDFYSEKTFDIGKKESVMQSNIDNRANKLAGIISISTSTGNYHIENAKYTSLQDAQQEVFTNATSDDIYGRELKQEYDAWKQKTPNTNVTYTYYDHPVDARGNIMNDRIVEKQGSYRVDNEEDYLNYVVAPKFLSEQITKQIGLSKPGSVGVITSAVSDVNLPPVNTTSQQYHSIDKSSGGFKGATDSSGNQIYTDNLYVPLNANTELVDPLSQIQFTLSDDVIVIQNSGADLKSGASYQATSPSTDLIPIAKDKLSYVFDGKTYTVNPGEQVLAPQGNAAGLSDFLTKNKDKFSWKAAYKLSIKDANGTADVYKLLDKDPSWGNKYKAWNYNGTMYNYNDGILKWESDYNKQYGTTTTPKQSTSTGGGTGTTKFGGKVR